MTEFKLSSIVKQLKKDFGSLSIAEDMVDPHDFVSTGNLAFDLISDGGIPYGGIAEFLGLSASGKSTIIQRVIANSQKKFGAVGILIDREKAYTKKRAEQLGIDNDNIMVLPPENAILVSDAFNFLIDSITKIRAKSKDIYITAAIDSIGAFDQDTSLENSSTPRKAKSLHAGFRKIMPYIDDKVMFLFTNHVTYRIVLYGNPATSSGGEAPKYYSNVRFSLEDAKTIIDPKRNNEVMGNWLRMESIKTRLGPCHRSCMVRHLFKTGIDYYSGYARLLADRGYLKPKNKKEFNKFNQTTLKYNDSEINSDKMEEALAKFPELLFSEYPEYNIVEESEEEIEEEIEGEDE